MFDKGIGFVVCLFVCGFFFFFFFFFFFSTSLSLAGIIHAWFTFCQDFVYIYRFYLRG